MFNLIWENIELFCEDITNVIVEDKKIIVEDLSERRFILSRIMAKRQFLNHLGLGYRSTMDNDDKQNIITNAVRQRAEKERLERLYPLVLRKINVEGEDINVGSVVTADYTELPVEETVQICKTLLDIQKIQHQIVVVFRSEKVDYFHFDMVLPDNSHIQKVTSETILCGLILNVGHSGENSVSINPKYKVLRCGNVSIGANNLTRLVHKTYTKEELFQKLALSLDLAIKNLGNIRELVERGSQDVPIAELNKVFVSIIREYPKHIQKKLAVLYVEKYSELKGYWRISQCLSDVGSNSEGITPRYRQVLQQQAFNVLQGGQ